MIVLAYLRSQYTKFHAYAQMCCFLRPFIWSGVSDLMRFSDVSDRGTNTLQVVQITENVRRRLRQWLYKSSGKRAWSYMCVWMTFFVQGRPKKVRQVKCQVKSMLIISFDIKGFVRQKFVMVDKTVNSADYCNISHGQLESVRRLRPELWRQTNWLLLHDNAPSHTSLFTREFLTKTT
jgi:hypothetical protein